MASTAPETRSRGVRRGPRLPMAMHTLLAVTGRRRFREALAVGRNE